MKIYRSNSEAQTRAFGRRFGKTLRNATVIALEGELGAGKTQFVKGLARGLGVKHIIQSPTFVLMRVYPVNQKKIKWLVHLDCYRLSSVQDLLDIGLADYLEQEQAVIAIEWANKVRTLLPKEHSTIRLSLTGPDQRKIAVFCSTSGARIGTRGTSR